MGIHTGRLQSLFSRERRAGDAAARDWRKGKFPSFSPVPRGRASRDTGQPAIISWVCQRPCMFFYVLNVPLACEGTPCPVWFKKSLHQISMGYRCEKSHWPVGFCSIEKGPSCLKNHARLFRKWGISKASTCILSSADILTRVSAGVPCCEKILRHRGTGIW